VSGEQIPRLKILHLLNDGGDELSAQVIEAQSRRHQVRVFDLRESDISYERLVAEIFAHDKVISW
jgi:hypothetical protein